MGAPLCEFISSRTGKMPAIKRFASNKSCSSSSLSSGATRKVRPLASDVCELAGSGGSSVTGFTLNNEVEHDSDSEELNRIRARRSVRRAIAINLAQVVRDFGFWNSDFGSLDFEIKQPMSERTTFPTRNPKSQIPIPKFEIPHHSSQPAVGNVTISHS